MKKLLADESADFRIVRSLREDNYQIEAIIELTRKMLRIFRLWADEL